MFEDYVPYDVQTAMESPLKPLPLGSLAWLACMEMIGLSPQDSAVFNKQLRYIELDAKYAIGKGVLEGGEIEPHLTTFKDFCAWIRGRSYELTKRPWLQTVFDILDALPVEVRVSPQQARFGSDHGGSNIEATTETIPRANLHRRLCDRILISDATARKRVQRAIADGVLPLGQIPIDLAEAWLRKQAPVVTRRSPF